MPLLVSNISTIEEVCNLAMQQPKKEDVIPYGVTLKYKGDYVIFDYTSAADYAGDWTFFQRVSRGLIINWKTGEVVARPFDKFFNFGQNGFYPDKNAHIVGCFEKVDGSLGILYREVIDGIEYHKVSTRGSFDSEQAIMATKMLHEKYCIDGKTLDMLNVEYTLLFEIVYPENKIVLNYGGKEELVLLAIRNRVTGEYVPFYEVQIIAQMYDMRTPEMYQFVNNTELIEMTGDPEFQDKEGVVVLYSDGSRFKFKTDTYVHLHRLISNVTKQKVMMALQTEKLEEYISEIPDEHRDLRLQMHNWRAEILAEINEIKEEVFSIVESFHANDNDFSDLREFKKALALYMKSKNIEKHIQAFVFHYAIEKDSRLLKANILEYMIKNKKG